MSNFYKPPAQTDPAPKNDYRLTGSTLRFDTTIDRERVDANNPDLSVVIDVNLGGDMPLQVIDLRGLPVNDKGDKVMLDGRTINGTGAFLIEAPGQLDLNKGTGFKLIREGESVTLGRKSHEDRFEMPDTVSRKHAEVAYIDGVLTLTDLGSANATFASSRLDMAPDKSDVVEVGSAGPRVVNGLGGGAFELAAAEPAVPVVGDDGMVLSFKDWQQRKAAAQSAQAAVPSASNRQPRQQDPSKVHQEIGLAAKQESLSPSEKILQDLKLTDQDRAALKSYAAAAANKRTEQRSGNGGNSMFYSGRMGDALKGMSAYAAQRADDFARALYGDDNVAR